MRRLRPAPGWTVGLVVASLVALAAVVAVGARRIPGGEARPPPFELPDEVLSIGFAIIALVGLALLVVALLSGRRSRRPSRGGQRNAAAVILLLLLAGAVYVLQRPEQAASPPPLAVTEGEVVERAVPATQLVGTSWGLVVLLVAVLLAVVALAALARGRVGESAASRQVDDEDLAQALDRGLRVVRLGDDPRSAVLLAYAAMETSLSSVGAVRRSSEAPGEYLARVAPQLGARSAAGAEITRLFSIARFGNHPVGEGDRRRAEEALLAIRTELSLSEAAP